MLTSSFVVLLAAPKNIPVSG